MNNIDVTSATNQKLKNVNVTIDSKGNIYIEGKQYQVTLENSYTPLQKAPETKKMPRSKNKSQKTNNPTKNTQEKSLQVHLTKKVSQLLQLQDVAKP